VAVFERFGRTLRVFDESQTDLALKVFAEAFKKSEIYPELRKITVKYYPKNAVCSLEAAGFTSSMLDWELYK
jgi:ATP-dependent Lhr-like helicase